MSPHSRILLLASLAALVAGGCATSPPYAGDVHAGDSELASRARDEYGTLTESLFREDQALLGNEELKTILGSPVVLPDRAKLAVVRFGRLPYWWGWSEEFPDIHGVFRDPEPRSSRMLEWLSRWENWRVEAEESGCRRVGPLVEPRATTASRPGVVVSAPSGARVRRVSR